MEWPEKILTRLAVLDTKIDQIQSDLADVKAQNRQINGRVRGSELALATMKAWACGAGAAAGLLIGLLKDWLWR